MDFTVFKDLENYLSLAEHEERERTVVAYITLDNLQELTQYVRADYRSASVEAENLLKAWVESMNGIIKEYENDKYVAIFSKKELDKQILNDFDIRNRIMDLKIGDNSFPITMSMGIAAICPGCILGSGAHTREEFVEIDSLLPGLKVAFRLILHHF